MEEGTEKYICQQLKIDNVIFQVHKHKTQRQKRQKEEADCGKAAGKEGTERKKKESNTTNP